MSRRPLGRCIAVSALACIVVFSALSLSSPTARAQDYDFSVEREYVDVHIQRDGSIDIDYEFGFVNYGHLDGIDVGLPNDYYDASTATASIRVGNATYTPAQIRKSPYIPIGLAVEFTAQTQAAISPSGTRLTIFFHVNNPHMVYLNDKNETTAGIRFRPTWFSSEYQRGSVGELRARVFGPSGFQNPNETLYLEGAPWDSIAYNATAQRVMATWSKSGVSPSALESGSYDVGLAVPLQYVDTYYKEDAWASLWNTLGSFGDLCCTIGPCLLPAIIFGVIFFYGIYSGRKRMKDYFEPKLSVPGAGPRRDLTAVEAAIALERPLEMVATMILFALTKKQKVAVLSHESPMRLQKLSPTGEYQYETDYLAAIGSDGLVSRAALRQGLVRLIQDTQHKLKGFDYEATKRYYEAICEKAWKQVKADGTPEEFSSGLSDNNEWMMLDRNYPRRMHTTFIVIPHVHGGVGGPSPGTGAGISTLAQSYVNQVQSASTNLVTNINGLASEVTQVTNPPPPPSKSGWSGGGHGGGGCACACACACAGGGR